MSVQEKMNLTLIVITILVLIVGTPIIVRYSESKKNGMLEEERKRKYHNMYVYFYNNVLLRKRFRRIVKSFASMMCYDKTQLEIKSVKLFLKSVGVAVVIPIVGLFALQDFLLASILGLVGYIFYNTTVDKAIDKQELDISKELAYTVQSIRDNYSVTDNIPQAVISCERGSLLERPVNVIYEMLTDENSEDMLYEFKRTVPIRLLSTLATTCYINNNEGDQKSEKGSSAFSDELTTLRQEADARVRYLTKSKIMFKSLSILSLVGLFIMPFVDMFLLSQMPGTALYVKGVYGAFVKAGVILATLIVYYIISVLNRNSVVNQIDRIEWIDNLWKQPRVRTFVNNIIPKKYTQRLRWQKRLSASLSSKNYEYIYTLKSVAAFSFSIITFIACITFTLTAKVSLWNNYSSLSLTKDSIGMTEKMLVQIKKVDIEYMTQERKLSDDDAEKLVKANVQGITDLDVQQQVDRLSMKWDYYYSLTFKWWFVLIALAGGVAGWFLPEISLEIRKMLVRFESTEDVMQLQTTMLTLSNTKMDVYTALYWLTQEATVHKGVLRYCYLEFPSDNMEALQNLKDVVVDRDMKRLVSKLEKSVFDLALSDAFSDIALDKQQSLVVNELLQDEALKSKQLYAKMLVAIPAGMVLFLCGIMPIGLLGVHQLVGAFTLMG